LRSGYAPLGLRGFSYLSHRRPPVPWHEFIPTGCWPITCNFRDDVGDGGLRLDAVELRRLDDRVDCSGTLPSSLRSCEEPVFAADCDAAYRAFSDVIAWPGTEKCYAASIPPRFDDWLIATWPRHRRRMWLPTQQPSLDGASPDAICHWTDEIEQQSANKGC